MEDYEEVYRLWSNSDGKGLRALEDSRQGTAKFLSRNPGTSFVAILDGRIVGVILSGHDGRRGYIYHTAVNTAHRGQKIGKAMLDCVYSAMKDEGIQKLGLLVYQNNDGGNAFWKAQNWENRTDLHYYNKSLKESAD